MRTEKLQFGQTGWILGDLPNLLAGAMKVDIYSCPKCRKLEFYLADAEEELHLAGDSFSEYECEFYPADTKEEGLPQRQCPNCGKRHDFDYPKCPFCKYDYHT